MGREMGANNLGTVPLDRVVVKWSQAMGEKLRARRLEIGVSQIDLACSLRVSQSYLSKLERGDFKFPVFSVAQLLDALKVDETWL